LTALKADRKRKFMVEEGWANNHAVRLHYVQANSDSFSGLPLIYIHGAYGTAEDFVHEMETLSPRRCIALSLRSRGKSDAPETGYSFDDHVADIEALVNHLGIRRFCIMAWSVGVAYSIGYASRHSGSVASLILLDYPARYRAFTSQWVERVLSNPSLSDWKPHAVRAIQRESNDVPLWEKLGRIKSPLLVIGGGQPEALLKPEDVEKYHKHAPKAEIIVFNDSGHDVSKPDYDRFIRTITIFLEEVDRKDLS
jgi:pimeloyl-ACP methyl ester carboxylesterase